MCDDLDNAAVTALGQLLRTDTTALQILRLNRLLNGTEANILLQSLVHNTTLRELYISCRPQQQQHESETPTTPHQQKTTTTTTTTIRSQCLRLLHDHQNCTLEVLGGGLLGLDGDTNIEFFLRLNASGRKRLLGASSHPTRKDFMDIMAHNQHCLSSLFYLLTLNPTLVCC